MVFYIACIHRFWIGWIYLSLWLKLVAEPVAEMNPVAETKSVAERKPVVKTVAKAVVEPSKPVAKLARVKLVILSPKRQ